MLIAPTHILLEMPNLPELSAAWLERAAEAEALWSIALQDREFADSVDLLHADGIPDLSLFAQDILGELNRQRRAVALDLYADGNGMFSREFGLMVRLGFFIHNGDCYRMTLPDSLTLFAVKQGAVGLSSVGENWGDGLFVLAPERCLHMHLKAEAEAWQAKRNAMRRFTVLNS